MQFVEPMLAKPVAELPEGPNWQYEIKWDGYRALGMKSGSKAALLSRRNNSLAQKFASILAALSTLEDGSIIDGEIVALDVHGRPSFSLLQHHKANAQTLVYYAFDVLAFRSRDVRVLKLPARMPGRDSSKRARSSASFSDPGCGAERYCVCREGQGLEGVVAKRIDSAYESGDRSGARVKFRVNKGQELVIGRYRIAKDTFDNLAVGYYDDRDRLIFIAKIKNGFTPALKHSIFEQLRKLETDTCPFDNLPEPRAARRGEALNGGGDETLSLGKAEACGTGGVYGLDRRRPSPALALRRPAR